MKEGEYITSLRGGLVTELKVQLTGRGVPMTPYPLFPTLEA